MKRSIVAAGFGVVVVLLSGCASSTSSAGHEASRAYHSARLSPSPDAPPGGATRQAPSPRTWTASRNAYAAVTAMHSQRLIDSLIQLQNANLCTWIRPGAPDLQVGYLTCATAMTQAGGSASRLATSLRASRRTRNLAYLGSPPASVAGLVNRTIQAAEHLRDAGASARGCVVMSGYTCLNSWTDFDRAMNRMNLDLVAWRPYE